MIQYDPSQRATWQTFRRVLDSRDYEASLRILRGLYYFHDPWLADDSYRFYHELMPLPTHTRDLLTLFLLGGQLEPTRVKLALGDALTDDLLAFGLLRQDEAGISTDQYGLITQNGMYFLITFPHPQARDPRRAFNVYIGQDSLKLVHALDRSRRSVDALDLCAGSGVIGQSIAPWSRHVDAVELCDEAIQVSKVNAVLNGVDEGWDVHQGDLWAPLEGRRYDLILTNPPFVAVPSKDASDFPIYGWGGEDGLLLIRRILEGTPAHLNAAGRLQMVFEGVGSAEQAAIEPLLEDFAAAHPAWSIKLNLYARMFLWEKPMKVSGEAIAQMRGEDAESHAQRYTFDILQGLYQRGFQYMYKALLAIDTAPHFGGGLEVQRLYNPWDLTHVPKQKGPVTFTPWQHQVMRSLSGISLSMNDQEHEVIQALDGTRSIQEMAQHVWEQKGGPMTGTAPGLFAEIGLDLCRVMHQLGFLEPPPGLWRDLQETQNPYLGEKHPLEQAMDAMEQMFKLMAQVEASQTATTAQGKPERKPK